MNIYLILFIVCFVLGLIFFIKPDWHVRFLIWSQKVFLEANFVPSKKTKIIVRYYGVIFIFAALIFLFSAFR